MEIALLIDGPVSSATLRDLRTPMIVGARDRDGKCDNNRHDHSAKYPTEEGELHLISFVHFVSKLTFAPFFPLSEI